MQRSRQILQELSNYAQGRGRFTEPQQPEFAPGTNYSRTIAFAQFFDSLSGDGQAGCLAKLFEAVAGKLTVMPASLATDTLNHLAWAGHVAEISSWTPKVIEILRERVATATDWTAAQPENRYVVERLLCLVGLVSPERFAHAASEVSAIVPSSVWDIAAIQQRVNETRNAFTRVQEG